jgi:MFS transporter, BCD family, chlorophyll transporter
MKSSKRQGALLRWYEIIRLGLVQAALGSIVVLISSTLNRVMVVEYAMPALLPGILVALHYAVQMARPRFGYGSDTGGRRTPWIIGGMAVLGIGGILCAVATVSISSQRGIALALAVAAYALVGFGVGAAGTSLLVLAAKQVPQHRLAAAATIMWIMMIAGFAITSTIVGHFLDPFSPRRLLLVVSGAAGIAFLVTLFALWRLEGVGRVMTGTQSSAPSPPRSASFRDALHQVWAEPEARGFTVFVFISMLAYSAQELLLEPFAGLVFGYSLGESARFSGLWHASALIGMIAVGVACSGKRRFGSLRAWTIGGCCASAIALLSLCCADLVGPHWPLRVSVSFLGVANGAFAVAAIGSMMELSHRGEPNSAGVRMGLWGAAQAIAFALGGVLATSVVDAMRLIYGSPTIAFAVVFAVEALLFFLAARFAKLDASAERRAPSGADTVAI